MSDIIQLLPDSVASQIAAGEVIQRPASAIKELMENAVDAGSSRIKVYLRDAGKTLIQVSDDGIGMSELDARLCFERHATSKIRNVNDLFTLHTMGFRGEALASIAAIARVEMKTMRQQDETGTEIIIEGSEVISQEMCAFSKGTTISVKNLFYNVPARRNFLKSNGVETRHIVEEFTRIALANPLIAFSLIHNDAVVFDLRPGNFRQRIAAIFGTIYNERLVPVEEQTSIVSVQGFAGKPEFAKKVRGEQYFFVNNRFIKDAYLNHAVTAAYENMIPRDCFATYYLKIEIDPAHIDVNIHPTKTEIKFEDEKSVYAIIRAAVKRSLGRFSIAPAIDFEQERTFDIPLEKMNERPSTPTIRTTPGYNPFNTTVKMPFHQNAGNDAERIERWSRMHEIDRPVVQSPLIDHFTDVSALPESSFHQLYNQYILVNTPDVLVIDQQKAHEQVIYEKFRQSAKDKSVATQQQLFPQPLEFTVNEASLLTELLPELRLMGFDIAAFGANTFVVHGAPEEVAVGSEKELLHAILDQQLQHREQMQSDMHDSLARALARQLAVKGGQPLNAREMKELVASLFKCSQQHTSPSGKAIVISLSSDKLSRLFTEGEAGKTIIRRSNV